MECKCVCILLLLHVNLYCAVSLFFIPLKRERKKVLCPEITSCISTMSALYNWIISDKTFFLSLITWLFQQIIAEPVIEMFCDGKIKTCLFSYSIADCFFSKFIVNAQFMSRAVSGLLFLPLNFFSSLLFLSSHLYISLSAFDFLGTSNFCCLTEDICVDISLDIMSLNLINSSYLNSNNLKVLHNSAYANVKCIHQRLLKNILQCYRTFQCTICNSSN